MGVYRDYDTMPFGKYRDVPLSQIPIGYLKWVVENCENASDELIDAVQDEIDSRGGSSGYGSGSGRSRPSYSPPPPPSSPGYQSSQQSGPTTTTDPGLPLVDVEDAVEKVRRKYAATCHPDRGGSVETMQLVNRLVDDVLKSLRERSSVPF